MYEGIATSGKQARKEQHKYYYTGKPCSRGHVTLRHAHNNTCTECESERPARNGRPIKTDARKVAKSNGDKRYDGAPCKHCGNTEKFTSNKRCTTNTCQNPKMSATRIQLLIIERPGRHITWYAKRARRKPSAIYDAMRALNIPRGSKPQHYVG